MLKASPLPSGWRSVPLRDAARIVSGGTPSRTRADFWTGLLPWASAKDLKTFRLLDTEEHVSREGAADGSRIVPKGSVLILVRGMTLMKDVPIALTECDMALNQDLRALLPKDGVHAEFLGYALASQKHALMGLVDQAGHGTGRLSTEQLEAFRIMVPDSIEQRAIARVLRQYDKAATVCGTLLKARRKLKRGLLQQLLTGQRRFPEFCKQPWVEHRLGDLFEERIELGRVELPLLSITADRGIVPRDSIDRSDTSSADKSLYKRIAPGDIGYNTMRMWQGVSALSALDGIVSPAYTICSPRKGVHGAFFAHLFKFPPVVHRFWRYSQGLVDDTLNLKFHEFSQVRVNVPSDVREQERIAILLDTTDLELAQLRALHDALKKQKKGLMQKLLTGQVRVPASMLKEASHA